MLHDVLKINSLMKNDECIMKQLKCGLSTIIKFFIYLHLSVFCSRTKRTHDYLIFFKQEDSDGPMHDTSLDVVSSDGAGSRGDDPGSPTQPNDGKHSLLQFALNHFRQSPEKYLKIISI